MIRSPRFFQGTCLLFWGWQTRAPVLALIPALFLEIVPFSGLKFEFKTWDFNKFVDVATVMLACAVIFALTDDVHSAYLFVLQWLPLIFFPVAAAQALSREGSIPVRSFFLTSRRQKKEQEKTDIRKTDVSAIYGVLCLIAAGTANHQNLQFFSGASVLFSWLFFTHRCRRVPLPVWLAIIVMAAYSGFWHQRLLKQAAVGIEQWITEIYMRHSQPDPFMTATALGDIGKLKLSGRIVSRLKPDDHLPGTTYLLHGATYNRMSRSYWFATDKFEPVKPGTDNTRWEINPVTGPAARMRLYFRCYRNKTVLNLPPGILLISGMKAGRLEKNGMGTLRMEDGPTLVTAEVVYTEGGKFETLPGKTDLAVPERELPHIRRMARETGIANTLSGEEIMGRIQQTFMQNYTYTLELKGKGNADTPLENFLFHTRAGHCEFFATAAVLLLRQSGIPARYATGYAAQEYSRLEKKLIVRRRDAHAWARVFINGYWVNFDATPPSYRTIDMERVPDSAIADIFSLMGFYLSFFRQEIGPDLMEKYGLWLMLPLGIILFRRLSSPGHARRLKPTEKPDKQADEPELEIHMDDIEKALSTLGFGRCPPETYFARRIRCRTAFSELNIDEPLEQLTRIYQDYRYGPWPLSTDNRDQFHTLSESVIRRTSRFQQNS